MFQKINYNIKNIELTLLFIVCFVTYTKCLSYNLKPIDQTCNTKILYDEEIFMCVPKTSSIKNIFDSLKNYYEEKNIINLKFVIKSKHQYEDFNLNNIYMELNFDDVLENFLYISDTENVLISVLIQFNKNLAILMDTNESTIAPGEILNNCGTYKYQQISNDFLNINKRTFEQNLEKIIFNIFNEEQKDEHLYEQWLILPENKMETVLKKINDKIFELFKIHLDEYCNRGISLWFFLFKLLMNPNFLEYIAFSDFKLGNNLSILQKKMGSDLTNMFYSEVDNQFIIKNPYVITTLWGMCKNQQRMSFRLFSNALKHYYDGNLLEKIESKHFTYNFKFNIECLVGIDKYNLKKMNEFDHYDIGLIDRMYKGLKFMVMNKIKSDIDELKTIWNPLNLQY